MNIPLNIDWQQILLHLMNFVILAGGLYFLLYRPVKAFMAKREAYYAEQAAAAEQMNQAAEKLHAEYQKKLDDSEEELALARKQSQRKTQAAAAEQLDAARAQAEHIVSEAEAQAARSRDKIMEEAREQVRDLAVEATEKLVLTSSGDAFDRFLDLAEKEGEQK